MSAVEVGGFSYSDRWGSVGDGFQELSYGHVLAGILVL